MRALGAQAGRILTGGTQGSIVAKDARALTLSTASKEKAQFYGKSRPRLRPQLRLVGGRNVWRLPYAPDGAQGFGGHLLAVSSQKRAPADQGSDDNDSFTRTPRFNCTSTNRIQHLCSLACVGSFCILSRGPGTGVRHRTRLPRASMHVRSRRMDDGGDEWERPLSKKRHPAIGK